MPTIEVASGVGLWARQVPGPPAVPVLLLPDAGECSASWPDELVARLAAHRPVLLVDQRGTGRATRRLDDVPTGAELAADAVAVLDTLAVARAHVVGMGTGGLVAQLLLLDHAERVASAVLLGTGPLPGPGVPALPGPDPALLRMWAEADDPRDPTGELAWRVELRRLLHGAGTPFDHHAARAAEERVIAHAGTDAPPLSARPLVVPPRAGELAAVQVPVLVLEGAHDPVHPPPAAAVLARLLGTRAVRVPGLGHHLAGPLVPAVAEVILAHLGD